MSTYIDDILPAIAAPGDDANYGSAATLDVLCLQARIAARALLLLPQYRRHNQ